MKESADNFAEWNKLIYSEVYSPESQHHTSTDRYQLKLIEVKKNLLATYARGRTVDLGCGIGEYSRYAANFAKEVIGIDFSQAYINYASRIKHVDSNVKFQYGDISDTYLGENSVDCIFSYSAIYYVANLRQLLLHISQILKSDGFAILDFANSISLMDLIYRDSHRRDIAHNFSVPYAEILSLVNELNFEILAWRSFQLLPAQGISKRYFYMWPLTSKFWKPILTLNLKGKTLDERMSSSILRRFSFRHIVVVRKK
jgi:SAM-dependent methyltransferase